MVRVWQMQHSNCFEDYFHLYSYLYNSNFIFLQAKNLNIIQVKAFFTDH